VEESKSLFCNFYFCSFRQ